MGEIAEMMLDGTMCQVCGEFMGESVGYPITCTSCQPEHLEALDVISPDMPNIKNIKCTTYPKCKKMFGTIEAMKQHRRAKHVK